MNQNHGLRTLLVAAAASLLTTGAWAENPSAPQGKTPAADKAERAPANAAGKAEKAADVAGDKAAKTAKDVKDGKDAIDPAAKADERAARKAKEHDAQREKLAATWKGPVSDPLRHELRLHAERLARLERIKAVAEKEKDAPTAEKAAKLVTKENERHAGWMTKNTPVIGAAPAVGAPPVAPTAPADGKGGAK
ncbi:MAG: hypothetical protein KF795_15970 [Labilithrix sp.]|nr:hypothetical protein [Labilithrix sp.]